MIPIFFCLFIGTTWLIPFGLITVLLFGSIYIISIFAGFPSQRIVFAVFFSIFGLIWPFLSPMYRHFFTDYFAGVALVFGKPAWADDRLKIAQNDYSDWQQKYD